MTLFSQKLALDSNTEPSYFFVLQILLMTSNWSLPRTRTPGWTPTQALSTTTRSRPAEARSPLSSFDTDQRRPTIILDSVDQVLSTLLRFSTETTVSAEVSHSEVFPFLTMMKKMILSVLTMSELRLQKQVAKSTIRHCHADSCATFWEVWKIKSTSWRRISKRFCRKERTEPSTMITSLTFSMKLTQRG